MLDNYDEGTYELGEVLIKKMDETKAAKYRNKFLGFVFQSFNLINYKNALENVVLPLYYQGVSRKEREEKALKYLDDVGLKEWANHLPTELSGGQKQRVAIARAMVGEPKVLLADEPTGALDSKTSKEVMDLIQKINKAGKTILVVTHEEDIAQMCSRIVRLKDGVIVEDKKIKQNKKKKIIKFLNLDWEENCADHTKNVTGIKTVSIAQARRPIYRSSVNLSDNYKESLN
jgi:putative ABC transport system ATP-binding protein